MDIYQILEAIKFAGEPEQKPGDQVRGTEKAKPTKTGAHPFKGRLVGASESVEQECSEPMTLADRLKARWEETKKQKGLMEFGANNPTQDSADPKDELTQATQAGQANLTALKQAGVDLTTGVPQATQSAVKVATNPTAIPTSQDKKISGALGNELEQLATKTDPGKFKQVVNAIKTAKQQGGM